MERVAGGFALAEAPVAAPDGGVYFSDVLGGGVHHWSPGSGEVETVIPKRRGVGGMALHADGGLVVSGRDVSHVRGGESRVLFADEEIAGLNDLTVDPDGHVVVGILRFHPFAGEDPVPGEFIRIGGGAASTVMPGVEWVNGCGYSPDGATFYGCDYRRGLVLAAERRGDGSYAAPSIVIESPSGEADGMAIDENGGIWVALGGRATVARFRPDGTLEQELEVPADFVASLCFGGSDLRDVFITTTGNPADASAPGGVFKTRSSVAGYPTSLCTT
jgi:gluconolactonase